MRFANFHFINLLTKRKAKQWG